MFTRPVYTTWQMLTWTRHEIVLFTLIATVPVVAYDVLGLKRLYVPWLPIALVGTAVAFVLGFRNNAAYGRLWEARKIWGGIVNASRAWGLMVNDFITNDFTDDKASETELCDIRKRLIYRHIAWLTTLRHALRAERPWEQFLKHHTNRGWADRIQVREHRLGVEEELDGYISDAERSEVLAKTNSAAQLLAVQSAELRQLRTRHLIEDFRHMEMEQVVVNLLELQGKSERIKNFPYPRQYATLNHWFVWIFVLLVPFGIAKEFDVLNGSAAEDPNHLGQYAVWLSVPLSVLVMWIFHTMERIGRVGENPFEGSANDIPITTMSRGIEIDLREMLGEPAGSIPAPIKPRYDTQM